MYITSSVSETGPMLLMYILTDTIVGEPENDTAPLNFIKAIH